MKKKFSAENYILLHGNGLHKHTLRRLYHTTPIKPEPISKCLINSTPGLNPTLPPIMKERKRDLIMGENTEKGGDIRGHNREWSGDETHLGGQTKRVAVIERGSDRKREGQNREAEKKEDGDRQGEDYREIT